MTRRAVSIWGRDEEKNRRALERLAATGSPVAAQTCDVADADAVQRAFDATLARFGRVDGMFANAGVAGGGDVILIPEIPWTFEGVIQKIRQRDAAGRHFTLVVVAEGARWPDGNLVACGTGAGTMGEIRLGGIGQQIAEPPCAVPG